VKLQHQIPEYLPIRGKKAKIYYHGILPFCSNCHTIGHQTNSCSNPSSNWWSYIEKLKRCDIPLEFFGSWLVSNTTTSTPNRGDDTIKAQFLSFMQEFITSPAANNQSTPNRFEPLFKFSPQLKASIDQAKNPKAYKGKKKDKSEQSKPPKPNPGSRGGKGGRGGGRGGRGGNGRGRGAGANAVSAN
jgi:hypothetical protein